MTEPTPAPETDELQTFEEKLRAADKAITREFLEIQQAAEEAWALYQAKKRQIQAFRSKYGPVLKAFDEVEKNGATQIEVPVDEEA